MLNISIFHEKATDKEEKSSQETFWSPLQQIKESLSLQLRGPRCSFPAWNALLQEVCYCPHVLQKEISSAESYQVFTLVLFVSLFFHGHRVISTIWVLNLLFISPYWK